MATKSYYEKLKDPRWQKKRLEVMQLKEFCCEICYDNESTLNVHHKEYFKGKEPWEYENNQLAVLCESCHKVHHDSKDLLKYISSILEYDGPNDRCNIGFILAGYIGLDYYTALKNSEYEDCSATRCFYDAGVNLSKSDFNFKHYAEMFEVQNG